MKELKIQAPEGYVIDRDNSTFERIVFKPKENEIKTWEDLCKIEQENYVGYFVGTLSNVNSYTINNYLDEGCRNLFLTKEEAVSSRAAAMISQLMPYYGGAIKKHEWSDDDIVKYIICRDDSNISVTHTSYQYHYLAFRTEKYRDEFLKENRKLVEDYFMI